MPRRTAKGTGVLTKDMQRMVRTGDAGFGSRNPDYTGLPGEVIQYRLSNGQVDEYPASWALPVGEVKKALQHFLRTGEPAPRIVWHNDSGDGVVIGRTT